MDRKAVARETLNIMAQGYYTLPLGEGPTPAPPDTTRRVDIKRDMEFSIKRSRLIRPEEGAAILKKYEEESAKKGTASLSDTVVENISTVEAIRRLAAQGRENIGVLNFASAKNPGGGFINGAMAQEESLAASSTLYRTLTANEEYYRENRAHRSMIYTDYAIYSPDVVFFRDGNFKLAEPVKASVLTLPAVNMGQVMQKGEDTAKAKSAMKRRMKLALAIFARQGAKNLVLGAYGCGVFRNDPWDIAAWWEEHLESGLGDLFDSVFHAVLDRSRDGTCIKAFLKI